MTVHKLSGKGRTSRVLSPSMNGCWLPLLCWSWAGNHNCCELDCNNYPTPWSQDFTPFHLPQLLKSFYQFFYNILWWIFFWRNDITVPFVVMCYFLLLYSHLNIQANYSKYHLFSCHFCTQTPLLWSILNKKKNSNIVLKLVNKYIHNLAYCLIYTGTFFNIQH